MPVRTAQLVPASAIRKLLYSSLTPAERALLKLLEGLACAALVAALPIVASALSHNAVNWPDVARAALAAVTAAVFLALAKYAKYAKAHGDPALGDILVSAASSIGAPAGPPSPSSPPGVLDEEHLFFSQYTRARLRGQLRTQRHRGTEAQRHRGHASPDGSLG